MTQTGYHPVPLGNTSPTPTVKKRKITNAHIFAIPAIGINRVRGLHPQAAAYTAQRPLSGLLSLLCITPGMPLYDGLR